MAEMTNRAWVGDALELLAKGLKPFVKTANPPATALMRNTQTCIGPAPPREKLTARAGRWATRQAGMARPVDDRGLARGRRCSAWPRAGPWPCW